MEFERLPGGAWIIARWSLSTPVLRRDASARRVDLSSDPNAPTLVAIHETRGEVQQVRAMDGRDLTTRAEAVSARPATISGVLYDSTRSAPLVGATVIIEGTSYRATSDSTGRFSLSGSLDGVYRVAIEHPRLAPLGLALADELSVSRGATNSIVTGTPSLATLMAMRCGTRETTTHALLVGAARTAGDGDPIPNAAVTFTRLKPGSKSATENLQIISDSTGYFRTCALPTRTAISARASVNVSGVEKVGVPTPLTLTPGALEVRDIVLNFGTLASVDTRGRDARATLGTLSAAALSSGRPRLSGMATDPDGHPIPMAIVTDARGAMVAIANDSGRFVLSDLHARGALTVRRIGFSPERFTLPLASDTEEVHVTMTPLPRGLAEVLVNAENRSASLERRGFYERMREHEIGALDGYFVTPEMIAARHPARFTQLLYNINGIRMTTSRYDRSMGPFPLGRRGCLTALYIDGIKTDWHYSREQMQAAIAGENIPSDAIVGVGLDRLVPVSQIKAIEVYPSDTQTPPQFQNLNGCGAVAVWTKVD